MISVIGAGAVGAHTALRCAEKGLGDVLLVDVVNGLPQAEALDIMHVAPLGIDVSVTGSNDFRDIGGSTMVIVTAGFPRTPDITRMGLIGKNAAIVRSVAEQIAAHAPDAVVIVVTNPMDIMTWAACKTTGFPRQRVIGMGGLLDTMRLSLFLSWELHVPTREIQSFVIGEHGDSMVPLISRCSLNGKPVNGLLTRQQIERITGRVKNSGSEIIRGKGRTLHGPAAAIAHMAECIIRDKKEILPASVYLQGEYGLKDICIGVPVRLGKNGAEEIIEFELDSDEQAQFLHSAASIEQAVREFQRAPLT